MVSVLTAGFWQSDEICGINAAFSLRENAPSDHKVYRAGDGNRATSGPWGAVDEITWFVPG